MCQVTACGLAHTRLADAVAFREDGVERLLRDGGLTDVRTAHREVEAAFRDAEHLVEFSSKL